MSTAETIIRDVENFKHGVRKYAGTSVEYEWSVDRMIHNGNSFFSLYINSDWEVDCDTMGEVREYLRNL